MPLTDLFTAKELEQTYQPLLLCEFTFSSGRVLRLSTHPLSTVYGGTPTGGTYEYGGEAWLPRVQNQDIGATQAMSDIGVEIAPSVTVTIADPDKAIYNIWESNEGFKGAKLKLYAIMWDAGNSLTGAFSTSVPLVKFIGTCNSPSIDDRSLTVTAQSLLNMTSMQFPPVRIQVLCPYAFPGTLADQIAAADNRDSIFYECGYSYSYTASLNCVGNPDPLSSGGTGPFVSCDYSDEACIERLGNPSALVPIQQDLLSRPTGRFGGSQWIPNQNGGLSRGYITGKWDQIINATNDAKYGDYIPMCYGQTWVEPLVMGVWGDANYTNFEILLCFGEIDSITKVVVNGQEVSRLTDDSDAGNRPVDNDIPSASYTNTFKNGYWKTVNRGLRNGVPNPNPGWGRQGDPYGSQAVIYVSVLTQVASADSIPSVQVLLSGQQVRVYSNTETFDYAFTRNPVWILMDVLTWANWKFAEMDIQSFLTAAAKCDTQIYFTRMDGVLSNVYAETDTPPYARYSVGFSVKSRQSIGELIRGLRNAMKALLFFDFETGLLKLVIKETLASQQTDPIFGSNYVDPVPSVTVEGVSQNGYVAYKFDQNSILKINGRSTLSVYQNTNQDAPNKATISFQNRENSYSQDSATIIDAEDVSRIGQDIFGQFSCVGPQTYDHVRRVTNTWFAENFRGNNRLDYTGSAIGDTGGTLLFQLQTTIKAIHLQVGDICLLSDAQLGIDNALVRVMKIKPSTNFETCQITLSWHNDNWYQDSFGQINQPKYPRPTAVIDRPPFSWKPNYEAPISGDQFYDPTDLNFGITQFYETLADLTMLARARITGEVPINAFPTFLSRPKLELTGVSVAGGSYPTSASLYVSVAEATGDFTSASPISRTCLITLQGSNRTPKFAVQDWGGNTPSGYFVFAGQDHLNMCFQQQGTGAPSLISLTNSYQSASWGPPDEAFSRFRWNIRRAVHCGVWGQEIVATATPTAVVISTFDGYGFNTNQWANRVVSVLGLNPKNRDTATNLPIANFLVSANDGSTLTISSGNPATCVGGNPLLPGDVVVMRNLFTYGQDTTGFYFEDSEWVNALNPVFPALTISGASNTTPVVVSFDLPASEPFPYAVNDHVVIQQVRGMTSINGGWVVSAIDTTNKRVTLTGSSPNAAYTTGGWIAKQKRGLDVNAETGNLAFIVKGTGRGTWAIIKSNTATRCYIEGNWPITPDATSQIIILEPVLQYDQPSSSQNTIGAHTIRSFDIDITNWPDQTLFVQAFTESSALKKNPDIFTPFREIYLFGKGPTSRYITAGAFNMLPDDTHVDADATDGDITYGLLPFSQIQNKSIFIQKIDNSAHTVTVQCQLGDTMSGVSSEVLTNQWDWVIVITSALS